MKMFKLRMTDVLGIVLSFVNIALLSRLYSRWEGWKELEASHDAGTIRHKPHTLSDVTQALPSGEYTAVNSNMPEGDLPTTGNDYTPRLYVNDVDDGVGEFDIRLPPVAHTQQLPIAAVGGMEPVHCSTSYDETLRHPQKPDPRLSFGALLESFDAFMEAWASNAASPVPFFIWSCVELCPYEVPVHPLKATQLLAHRSYSLDPQSMMMSASMDTAVHDDSSHVYTKPSMERWESMADTHWLQFGDGMQNSGRLLLGVSMAIVFAVAWYVARSRGSLGLDNGKLSTVDYACQVGHGAVDSSNIFAATRLSAPQAAACAMKNARNAITTVIERVSSGAGAWKRNGGRLQRAAREHRKSAHPHEESDHEESPKSRGALLGDADFRDNGVCGSRWMTRDPTQNRGDGGQHGTHSFGFHDTMNADRTDTAIDTIMDHDTQLQGGFSVGQPVWHTGKGHHHAVGY